jgi:hypothetical protein
METVWFIHDVAGTHMKIVNLPFIYQLAAEMQALLKIEYKPGYVARFDVLIASLLVKYSIERLLDEYPAMTVSRKPGEDLLFAIKQIAEWRDEMRTKDEADYDVSDRKVDYRFEEVLKHAKEFETILKADLLENLVAYHPQQKAGYSTPLSIAHAENTLHEEYLQKLSQKTIQEIRESGRCLVFDNYTASGFHMLRALELVLHEYYVLMCKPKNPNKPLESWSAYLTPLYKLFSDKEKCGPLSKAEEAHVKKVYYLLQPVKELDRNNIMHPETFLSCFGVSSI